MKQKLFILSLLAVLAFSNAIAQCDPWIIKAYDAMYKRQPSSSECNIKNYNNGSWGSYPELVEYIVKYNSNRNVPFKGDPWIFRIYNELYNRMPTAFEVGVHHYNNGSWNSYDELKKYIQQLQNMIANNKLKIVLETDSKNNSNLLSGLYDSNGNLLTTNTITTQGGRVVAPGGANVVAAGGLNLKPKADGTYVVAPGGANVVAPGGANVVAPGGANVVAPGGGNIQFNMNAAGLSTGSRYRTLSGNEKLFPTSGNGAWIIK